MLVGGTGKQAAQGDTTDALSGLLIDKAAHCRPVPQALDLGQLLRPLLAAGRRRSLQRLDLTRALLLVPGPIDAPRVPAPTSVGAPINATFVSAIAASCVPVPARAQP